MIDNRKPSTSGIWLPASKVKEMGQLALVWIYNYREQERRKVVIAHMEELNARLGKLFGRKRPATFEEAENSLSSTHHGSMELTFAKWSFEEDEKRIKNLLLLAEHGDPVWVCADDMKALA